MTNVKPLADHLLVEPLEKDVETFAGGQLVLPDTAKDKPQQCQVLAAGPGARDDAGRRIPMEIKAGDIVVFAKYAGTKFKTEDGKDVLFMKESDVLATLI